ncbi:DMT family transporter [Hominifimenecus sp. rT4P-3]|uniref:DMT family transporter n=1 Tax=Hominifimenecus sp. rT4P-3 TaxID=3242979 RepID=UPI003DA52097
MNFFEKRPFLLLVVGILGISLSSVLVRYSTAPSLVTAAYRLLWTVLLMLPMTLGKSKSRQELTLVPKKTLFLCAASGILLALHFVLWFESLEHTSIASSTTIVCTEVIWVAIGSVIFLHKKISGKEIFCIAITLAGNILIALSDHASSNSGLSGDLMSLAAAIAVAGYTLLGGVVRRTVSTTGYTFIVYSFCAATLVLASLVSRTPLAGYGFPAVFVGLLLAIFSTLLGHSIFSWCLKYLSPSFVSASKLCEPLISAVLAFFLFQETPVFLQILGGFIILGGILLYTRVELKH